MRTVISAGFGLALAVSAFALSAAPAQAFEVPSVTPASPSAVVKVYGQDDWEDREERRLQHEREERREWRERQERREHEEHEWRERHERCEHVAHECSERHYGRYEVHECMERHGCER